VVVDMVVLIDASVRAVWYLCRRVPGRRYFMDEVLVVSAEDRVNRGTCVDLCPSGAIALA
jgi:ferredoxin